MFGALAGVQRRPSLSPRAVLRVQSSSKSKMRKCKTRSSPRTVRVQPPAVYKLSLVIDPLELLECDGKLRGRECRWWLRCVCSTAELGDSLLHFPRRFWHRVQSLCYQVTRRLHWLPALSSPSQLLLELRLSSLPSLPGLTLHHTLHHHPPHCPPPYISLRLHSHLPH